MATETKSDLRKFTEFMKRKYGIPTDVLTATNHPEECRCAKCAEFWRAMGRDPDTGLYGPFGKHLPRKRKPAAK